MASRKARRSSILKTRSDGGSGEIQFQSEETGGNTQNLTGVIKRRVSFSQTNQIKTFNRQSNSESDCSSSGNSSRFEGACSGVNMDMTCFDDSVFDGKEKENTDCQGAGNLNETRFHSDDDDVDMSLETDSAPPPPQPRRKSIPVQNKTVCGDAMEMTMARDDLNQTKAAGGSMDMSMSTTFVTSKTKRVGPANKTLLGGEMDVSAMEKRAGNRTLYDPVDMDVSVRRSPRNVQRQGSARNKTLAGGDMDVSHLERGKGNNTLDSPGADMDISVRRSPRSVERRQTLVGGDMDMTVNGVENDVTSESVLVSNDNRLGGTLSANRTVLPDADMEMDGEAEKERNRAIKTNVAPVDMDITLPRKSPRKWANKNKTIVGEDMDASIMEGARTAASATRQNQTIFSPAVAECSIRQSPRKKQQAFSSRNKTVFGDGSDMEMSAANDDCYGNDIGNESKDMSMFATTGGTQVSGSNKTILGADMDLSMGENEGSKAPKNPGNQPIVAPLDVEMLPRRSPRKKVAPPLNKDKPEKQNEIQKLRTEDDRGHYSGGTVMRFEKPDLDLAKNPFGRALRTGGKRRAAQHQSSMYIGGLGKFASAKTPKRKVVEETRVSPREEVARAEEVPLPPPKTTPPPAKTTREVGLNCTIASGYTADVSLMTTPTISDAITPRKGKKPAKQSMGTSPLAYKLLRKSVGVLKDQIDKQSFVEVRETSSEGSSGSSESSPHVIGSTPEEGPESDAKITPPPEVISPSEDEVFFPTPRPAKATFALPTPLPHAKSVSAAKAIEKPEQAASSSKSAKPKLHRPDPPKEPRPVGAAAKSEEVAPMETTALEEAIENPAILAPPPPPPETVEIEPQPGPAPKFKPVCEPPKPSTPPISSDHDQSSVLFTTLSEPSSSVPTSQASSPEEREDEPHLTPPVPSDLDQRSIPFTTLSEPSPSVRTSPTSSPEEREDEPHLQPPKATTSKDAALLPPPQVVNLPVPLPPAAPMVPSSAEDNFIVDETRYEEDDGDLPPPPPVASTSRPPESIRLRAAFREESVLHNSVLGRKSDRTIAEFESSVDNQEDSQNRQLSEAQDSSPPQLPRPAPSVAEAPLSAEALVIQQDFINCINYLNQRRRPRQLSDPVDAIKAKWNFLEHQIKRFRAISNDEIDRIFKIPAIESFTSPGYREGVLTSKSRWEAVQRDYSKAFSIPYFADLLSQL